MSIMHIVKQIIKGLVPNSFVVRNGPRASNALFLTFDDGPYPVYTEYIVDVLKDYNVPAHFFMTGCAVRENPGAVQKVVQRGHMIGNHTYSHVRSSYLELGATLSELKQTDDLLKRHAGVRTALIRPPYGKITFAFLIYSLLEKKKVVMWSYDSMDSFIHDDDQLLDRLAMVKGGDILLFHDDTEITKRNIQRILENLTARGFTFSLLTNR
jgi:peptidoglycan-N-acetylglucosamine deacetylase